MALGGACTAADDEFGGEPAGFGGFGAEEAEHHLDGGGAESVFGLADGREGDSVVFGAREIAVADE